MYMKMKLSEARERLANTRSKNALKVGSICWVRGPKERGIFEYPIEIIEDDAEETKIQEEEGSKATESMIAYGGPFVRKLGKLYRLGDSLDQRRLREAFPEYWEKYGVITNESVKIKEVKEKKSGETRSLAWIPSRDLMI